jgi:hypothetical protein
VPPGKPWRFPGGIETVPFAVRPSLPQQQCKLTLTSQSNGLADLSYLSERKKEREQFMRWPEKLYGVIPR